MKKQIVNMGLVASMVLVGITAAHASGNSGRITVTGEVVSTSCDVNVNGTASNNISVGSWVPADFKVGTADPLKLVNVVERSAKPFKLSLAHCAGKGDSDPLSVKVEGSTLNGNSSIFNEDPKAGAGIVMTMTPSGGAPELVADQGHYLVHTYKAKDDANLADGTEVSFTTYLAATSLTPGVQSVRAPIDFTIVNN